MTENSLLEDALRAYINRRCRRAYAHDLRNGLQGIFGGVDALTRAAQGTKPMAIPLEQVTQFVRQAIGNHERGLERVLESMAPEEFTAAPVSIRELLSELVRFLTNDAARNNVRVRTDFSEDLPLTTVIARLRLIALGLLSEAIDACPRGGEVRISGQPTASGVLFEIVDARTEPRPTSFVNDAIEHIVSQLSGRIESKQTPAGYKVRVELPSA
jgi:signal transduction histidine kinase